MFVHQKRQGQQKGSDLVRQEIISRRLKAWRREDWSPDGRWNLTQGGPYLPLRPEGRGEDGRGVGELEGAWQEAEVSPLRASTFSLKQQARSPGRWRCGGQQGLDRFLQE